MHSWVKKLFFEDSEKWNVNIVNSLEKTTNKDGLLWQNSWCWENKSSWKKLHHPQADIGNGETISCTKKNWFQGSYEMKVIFLDVDGVLNSEECLDVPEQSCEYLYDSSTIVPLLKRCVDNLQEICKATSAKVGKLRIKFRSIFPWHVYIVCLYCLF